MSVIEFKPTLFQRELVKYKQMEYNELLREIAEQMENDFPLKSSKYKLSALLSAMEMRANSSTFKDWLSNKRTEFGV